MEEIIINKVYESNYSGNFLVLEKFFEYKDTKRNGKNIKNKCILYKIKFLNSGNIYKASKIAILKGEIFDSNFNEKIFIDKIWKQNCGDELKVLYKEGDYYICKSLIYQNLLKAQKKEIKNGSVNNPEIENQTFIGKEFLQNCGDTLKVIEKTDKKLSSNFLFKCQFQKYPCEILALKNSILNGNVVNYNIPNQYGFFFGNGNYNTKNSKKAYSVWDGIITRCFKKEKYVYKSYGAKGVTVCEEWKCFQNFAKWYKENLFDYYNLELDKDILSNIRHLEQKIYSPETCLLIPKEINNFLINDNFVSGIIFYKNYFIANYSYEYIYELSNKFLTFKEAKEAYAKKKYEFWIKEIEKYNLPIQLKEILLKYDFSWSWIWENMSEKEIINKISK